MNPYVSKLARWILILAVVVFVFANPITRAVVLFLLPLGSGVDDFIEVIAIIALVVLLFAKGWAQFDPGPLVREMIASEKFKDAVLLIVAVTVVFLIPYTGSRLWNLILYGVPIVDQLFYAILVIAAMVVAIGWVYVRRTTK